MQRVVVFGNGVSHDLTYIRTHEGWLYVAVVVDLFSRQVVGWSMGSRIDTGLEADNISVRIA